MIFSTSWVKHATDQMSAKYFKSASSKVNTAILGQVATKPAGQLRFNRSENVSKLLGIIKGLSGCYKLIILCISVKTGIKRIRNYYPFYTCLAKGTNILKKFPRRSNSKAKPNTWCKCLSEGVNRSKDLCYGWTQLVRERIQRGSNTKVKKIPQSYYLCSQSGINNSLWVEVKQFINDP